MHPPSARAPDVPGESGQPVGVNRMVTAVKLELAGSPLRDSAFESELAHF